MISYPVYEQMNSLSKTSKVSMIGNMNESKYYFITLEVVLAPAFHLLPYFA